MPDDDDTGQDILQSAELSGTPVTLQHVFPMQPHLHFPTALAHHIVTACPDMGAMLTAGPTLYMFVSWRTLHLILNNLRCELRASHLCDCHCHSFVAS